MKINYRTMHLFSHIGELDVTDSHYDSFVKLESVSTNFDARHDIRHKMESHAFENSMGHQEYIHLITTKLFCHCPEYLNARQPQIFSVCNRMLICKCDDHLLWAYDRRIPDCNLVENERIWEDLQNYCALEDEEYYAMKEYNNNVLYVGTCFIYNDSIILSKAKPVVQKPKDLSLGMVVNYFPKWVNTKYLIIPGWNFCALIFHTTTGLRVSKEEAEPIMFELGYEYSHGTWAGPHYWHLENMEDTDGEPYNSVNIHGQFLLKSNENYNYGLCYMDHGLYWSYTRKHLEHYRSRLYMGKASLMWNTLILHKGYNVSNFDYGEVDSDVFFADWPAWKGSKYFIPPTGKYLYYSETGNRVPHDEALPVMTSLGYGWYPSMIVGDTEAGLFWYKDKSHDEGLIH